MAPRRPRPDDDAVSDVLGNILLIALTVGLAGTFSLAVSQWSGPPPRLHVELSSSLHAGADGWGSGDEYVELVHRGGPALHADALQLRIQGSASTLTIGPANDPPFDDGAWSLGEGWPHSHPAVACAEMLLLLVYQGDGGSQLLHQQSHTAHDGTCGGP